MQSDIIVGREFILDEEDLEGLSGFSLRPGKIVTLTDSRNKYFRARITCLEWKSARAFVFEEMPAAESEIEVILLQALPSRERMELIIEKTTELGVDVIVPFHSERSAALEDRDSSQKKSHRWQVRALRAAEQCRRSKVPFIAPYGGLEDALLWTRDSQLKLMLWEKERADGLKDLLRANQGVRIVSLLAGPEGGLTEREAGLLAKRGFRPVSLGGRILRTETAAIAGVAIIQYELGDLGSI
jgi:16S rRNA (uracil1498-N3)-methyltransferase